MDRGLIEQRFQLAGASALIDIGLRSSSAACG
jgi:hypothetical protein